MEWEFWTNSNDECGVLCDKQRKFIKVRLMSCECCCRRGLAHRLLSPSSPANQHPHPPQDFKPVAKQLESAGLVSFQPHYLVWVCQYGADSPECKTQCIRNGAYCCPDPDDNIAEGYSGADVLLVG